MYTYGLLSEINSYIYISPYTVIKFRGPFNCYVTQMGVGGVRFSGKKRFEGVMLNVISVTKGWVGVQFPENRVT